MKIVALSDNHGKLGFKLPDGDIVLHAGDICPDFAPGSEWGIMKQTTWLNTKFKEFLAENKVGRFMGTYGNHDFIVGGPRFSDNFLVDELIEVEGLKIWFTPWSNTFSGWAWMAHPNDLSKKYAKIPEGVDIIVSHQPPFGYGDQVPEYYRINRHDIDNDGHVGSKELLDTIDRVKPKIVLCGHIHSGYGKYTHNETTIYNVALVDESYKLVNQPMEIEI